MPDINLPPAGPSAVDEQTRSSTRDITPTPRDLALINTLYFWISTPQDIPMSIFHTKSRLAQPISPAALEMLQTLITSTGSHRRWAFDVEKYHCRSCLNSRRQLKQSKWWTRFKARFDVKFRPCEHRTPVHEFFMQLGNSSREIEKIVLTTERDEMDLEMQASAVNVLKAFFPHAEIRRQDWWKTASMPKFERTLSEEGRTSIGLT